MVWARRIFELARGASVTDHVRHLERAAQRMGSNPSTSILSRAAYIHDPNMLLTARLGVGVTASGVVDSEGS
jgi:hypothetical protein